MKGGLVVALAAAAMLGSACALRAEPTPAVSPTRLEEPPPVVLPSETQLLPEGVAAGGPWVGTSSFPDGFDPEARHPTVERLAEALAAALDASFSGGGRPTWQLVDVLELSDGRSLAVMDETGLGDDSVAGTQYAVVAIPEAGGWRLAELYARPLCRRGVSDGLCL